jgi:hypothetical protein
MSVLIKTNFGGRLYIADIDRYLEGQQTYEISDKDYAKSKILHQMIQRRPPLVTIFKENRKAPEAVVERVVEKNNPEEVQKIVDAVVNKLSGQFNDNLSQMEKRVTDAVKDYSSRVPGRAEQQQPSTTKSTFIEPDSSVIHIQSDKEVKSDVKAEVRVSEEGPGKSAIERLRELRGKQ